MRPDRSGVIVVLGRVRLGHEVIFALPVGQAIPKPELDWIEKYAQRENKPLITFEHRLTSGEFTGTTVTGYGPPEFVERVRKEVRSEDVLETQA